MAFTKEELLREYEVFRFGSDGIGGFVHPNMPDEVFQQLARLNQAQLTKVQLNQLLYFQMREVCPMAFSSTTGFIVRNIHTT